MTPRCNGCLYNRDGQCLYRGPLGCYIDENWASIPDEEREIEI